MTLVLDPYLCNKDDQDYKPSVDSEIISEYGRANSKISSLPY